MLSNSEWIQQLALSTVPQSIDQTNSFIKQNKKFEREQRQKYNLIHYGNSTGMSDKWQQGLSSIGSIAGAYAMSDANPTSQFVNSVISSGLNLIPGGTVANTIRQGVSAGLKAFDANIDDYDAAKAKRQGMTKAENIGNRIFAGLGIVPAAGKVDSVYSLDNKAKSSFSGLASNVSDMEDLEGKGLLFGLGKLNSRANELNKMVTKANDIAYESKRMESNYAPQLYAANNQMIYNGYTPGLTLHKKGGTIPELEEVRTIMQSLQSKKEDIQEPQKFQLGGKMNMIVTGALHARKHNLEELNPNLEGEITKKGIPVVVMNEGGEVQSQQAEVEREELVLQIDTTKTIEDYYDEYNSTDSKTEKNKIALECGKYLVDELLKNTDDPDKLIKKTV